MTLDAAVKSALRALGSQSGLCGFAGRGRDRRRDTGRGVVLPVRAGNPALSALPGAALCLLFCASLRRCSWRSPRPKTRRGLLLAGLAVLALAALGNAGLGAYHAGVEWGFWQGPTDCTGPVVDFGKAGTLLDRLDKVKVVRCDEVQWRFLGLSLAGYNVLISLLMAAIAGWGIAALAGKVR